MWNEFGASDRKDGGSTLFKEVGLAVVEGDEDGS